MFDVMDAYSRWAWLFFVAIAVLGGMFLVNLFLGVIFDEFMRAQEADQAEKEVGSGIGKIENEFDVDEEAIAILIKQNRARSDGSLAGERGGRSLCDCTPSGPQGCCGWRYGLMNFMTSDGVGNVSTFFVVFNLAIMCMPYADQPESWGMMTENLGAFVTWVFIVEMFFKLLGMGCAAYWGDGWNMLDGVIVSLSIGEMLITILLADTGINISFLRMLRLLRLLRLLKAWPGLYKIVMAFVKAIPQISNLFILMFLLMTIFSLLGMQVRHLPTSHAISPHLSPLLTAPHPWPSSACRPLAPLACPRTPDGTLTTFTRRCSPSSTSSPAGGSTPSRRVPRLSGWAYLALTSSLPSSSASS